jgi:RNA-binding protein YlmH
MFVHRRIGGYIAENLHRAGRDAVSAKLAARDSVSVPPREFESITVTVASPRLDGVVKALCGLSRESAADLIRRGEVQVNYTAEERCDRAVSPSDVVCVRGAGKYIVDAYEGENRRGRLRLAVRRYV